MIPNIRLAKLSDRELILTLLNNVFTEQQRTSYIRDQNYWQWKFQNSPFGKSIITVAEVNNEIIGVDNLWPWELTIKGSVIKAAQPCDSVVHPDYRGRGIFKLMRINGLNIAKANGFGLIFNFPNQNSLKANLKLGSIYLGKIPWYVKIVDPFKIMRGKISNEQSKPFAIDEKYKININQIRDLEKCFNKFDESIQINRKEGFFEWRYLMRPNRKYGMISCEKNGKNTVALFTLNQRRSVLEMIVVDFIGPIFNTVPLMRMVLKAGKQMGVGFIAVMNNSRFRTQDLQKLGFIRLKYKNMVVFPLDLSLYNIADKYSNWSLMAGMHDSI
jgi:hypothetical protein